MSGVRGVMEDSIGQVYFANAARHSGVRSQRPRGGDTQPSRPGEISGLTFGGKNLSWLYIAQGGKVFRRPTKTNGVAGDVPAPLPKPPL